MKKELGERRSISIDSINRGMWGIISIIDCEEKTRELLTQVADKDERRVIFTTFVRNGLSIKPAGSVVHAGESINTHGKVLYRLNDIEKAIVLRYELSMESATLENVM